MKSRVEVDRVGVWGERDPHGRHREEHEPPRALPAPLLVTLEQPVHEQDAGDCSGIPAGVGGRPNSNSSQTSDTTNGTPKRACAEKPWLATAARPDGPGAAKREGISRARPAFEVVVRAGSMGRLKRGAGAGGAEGEIGRVASPHSGSKVRAQREQDRVQPCCVDATPLLEAHAP